jgi:hypothetical protein
MIWTLLRTAATKIPWSTVAQNAPMFVDALGRVRGKSRLHEVSQNDLDDQCKALQAENARLAADLLQLSGKLQQLTARVATLTKVAGAALLLAVVACGLWIVK